MGVSTAQVKLLNPQSTFESTSRKDIYLDWFDTLSAARAHVKGALLA